MTLAGALQEMVSTDAATSTEPPGTTPAADTAVVTPDSPGAAPAGPGVADFAVCYRREMPGLVWFVMSLGASAEEAADAAQSAFAAAFAVWETIRYPAAWLRRVAQRAY